MPEQQKGKPLPNIPGNWKPEYFKPDHHEHDHHEHFVYGVPGYPGWSTRPPQGYHGPVPVTPVGTIVIWNHRGQYRVVPAPYQPGQPR